MSDLKQSYLEAWDAWADLARASLLVPGDRDLRRRERAARENRNEMCEQMAKAEEKKC